MDIGEAVTRIWYLKFQATTVRYPKSKCGQTAEFSQIRSSDDPTDTTFVGTNRWSHPGSLLSPESLGSSELFGIAMRSHQSRKTVPRDPFIKQSRPSFKRASSNKISRRTQTTRTPTKERRSQERRSAPMPRTAKRPLKIPTMNTYTEYL